MPIPWFVAVKAANFFLVRSTCHPINSRSYRSLGLSTWGLYLVGPFKKAKAGFTYIFVAMDKFTKWIEVKPAASITTAKVVEFIREIMYRFSMPNNIITDNGTWFTAREIKNFCEDSGIKINYTSVSHP
jgi:hypothetical protein